jgi:hypothetical protein
MGFHRHRQPEALNRVQATAAVMNFITEHEIASVFAAQDPFVLDHDCVNPSGHDPIASCGEVVCRHCARVFWR